MLFPKTSTHVIAQSVLSQSPRQVREIGVTMGYPITVTSIGNPHVLGVEEVYPKGGVPGGLKGWVS
jgi:hypothetical protein